jgi:hypothetical protein
MTDSLEGEKGELDDRFIAGRKGRARCQIKWRAKKGELDDRFI